MQAVRSSVTDVPANVALPRRVAWILFNIRVGILQERAFSSNRTYVSQYIESRGNAAVVGFERCVAEQWRLQLNIDKSFWGICTGSVKHLMQASLAPILSVVGGTVATWSPISARTPPTRHHGIFVSRDAITQKLQTKHYWFTNTTASRSAQLISVTSFFFRL